MVNERECVCLRESERERERASERREKMKEIVCVIEINITTVRELQCVCVGA